MSIIVKQPINYSLEIRFVRKKALFDKAKNIDYFISNLRIPYNIGPEHKFRYGKIMWDDIRNIKKDITIIIVPERFFTRFRIFGNKLVLAIGALPDRKKINYNPLTFINKIINNEYVFHPKDILYYKGYNKSKMLYVALFRRLKDFDAFFKETQSSRSDIRIKRLLVWKLDSLKSYIIYKKDQMEEKNELFEMWWNRINNRRK